MSEQIYLWDSPIGGLEAIYQGDWLVRLKLAQNLSSHPLLPKESMLHKWLTCYFTKKPLPSWPPMLVEKCTPFQKRVWQAIDAIPYGTTVTYSDIARQLSSHPRAVGQACKANPIMLVTPCHRVVGKSDLGGFAGPFCDVKRQLLELEQGQ